MQTRPRGELTAEARELLRQLLDDDDDEEVEGATCVVRPRPNSSSAPLSWQQERMWFLEQLDPGTSAFVLPIVLRIRTDVDPAALQRALNCLVARHEVLRTRFVVRDGQLLQIIEPSLTISLVFDDLQYLDPNQREREADRIGMTDIRKPFALETAPLLRARLIRIASQDHRIVIAMHHIVSDGWSIGVLVREITTLYVAALAGSDLDRALPPLSIQYGDFAHWQRAGAHNLIEDLEYWMNRLAGLPPSLQLPTDKSRPAEQTMNGGAHKVSFDEQTTARIRAFAQHEGVTLFMFLIGVFHVLLHRHSGQEDIAVGTPVAGRNLPQTEALIGLFLNTIVIRGDLHGAPSFRTFLSRVKESALGAYDHQDLPFERLVQELHPVRDLSRPPIFQVLFTLQVPLSGWGEGSTAPGAALEILDQGSAKYELTLHLQEEGSVINGYLEYNTDLFQHETIRALVARYQTLVESFLADPDESIATAPMLPAEERRKILLNWNDTNVPLHAHATVLRMFAEQARRRPDAAAVSCGPVRITYRELDLVTNALARRIRHMGVPSESLIGLCVERSVEMVIAAIGILKAGCAYVPLDPDFPPERLSSMLEESQAPMLLTRSNLIHLFPSYSGALLTFDTEEAAILAGDSGPLETQPDPAALAYVIFTSGSTGKPKGVMISHRALANFLESMRREPGMTTRDILLAVTTLSFDIAALELYLPLVSGAQVVIATRETAADGMALAAELKRSGATVMQATPASWRLLLESGWTGNRHLTALCGGEAISPELASTLLTHTGALWNMYGPTETTIWSLVHPIEEVAGAAIPIGCPIANTTVYILDERMQPVPPGVAGELYIGGAGLAEGYLGQPELTAARFISNPVPECRGERIYRTGDLALWTAGGTVHCLGRNDNQVKIRGYRVELGEIESALLKLPEITEAVVVARDDPSGGRRLVAFIRLTPTSLLLPVEEIRKRLRQSLPEYMVPAFIVPVTEFPKTANSKIDRKRLPDIGGETVSAVEFVPARDNLEEQLVSIWSEVLGRSSVGIRDNFFDLGGHSLLAARLFAGIEKVTGHHVPLASLFRAPTIEQLADKIRGGEWKADWSPVVELQRGTSTPFFCVHSLGANLVSYKNLSRLLDPAQQFYGLQPHGLDGQSEPQSSIPEMAESYLAEIRRIQPEGPYYLGGVCLGGVVAYEMAQRLVAIGERVGLLLLIDSEFPGDPPYQRTRPYNVFLADWHAGELMRLQPGQRWPYVRQKLSNGVERIRTKRSAIDSSLSKAVEKIRAANLQALLSYRAKPYDGKVTLFWSSEAAARCYEDLRLAWSAVAHGGLEVHVVPGNHLSMVEPPHLEVLAAELNAELARARREAASERFVPNKMFASA